MSLTVKVVESREGSVEGPVEGQARLVFGGLEAADGAGLDVESARRRGFGGEIGEVAVSAGPDGRIEVLLGLGSPDRLGRDALRRVGAAAVRALPGATNLAVGLDPPVTERLSVELAARSVAEGAALAAHRFTRYRSGGPDRSLEELVLVVGGGEAASARRGAERAAVVAESVLLARDLVNTPAGDLRPSDFAERAQEIAATEGLEVLVYDEEAARRERLGGLLGVAAGSVQPPRLVRLAYRPGSPSGRPSSSSPSSSSGRPPGSPAKLALVGKGITFDSGGLSLKPPASMETMKTDMSGAAAVLATLAACRRLDVGFEVVGFLPLTENLPGGDATKPGDVLRTRNGKTIEVLNTDAEGRLVLADALALAVEESPDAIVDLATLTGACVVALGRQIAGLFSNDSRLLEAVRTAALAAGEPCWPLPLPTVYRKMVDSDIADLKNIGAPGQAGALVAGLILQEFVGDVPWAHLDIAGPARSEEDSGYLRKGGTGFGVRTLIELLEHYEPLGRRAADDGLAALTLP